MIDRNGRSHILTSFSEALDLLRGDVVMMRDLTERNLVNAVRGFFDRDDARCKIAIADDEEIDLLEVQVDRDGIEVLTRFQPVARDLRNVVSSMRICTNLERVGDLAVSIARRACKLNQEPALPEADNLKEMYERSIAMFRESFRAYIEGDIAIANTLKDRDRELDLINRRMAAEFTDCMGSRPDRGGDYLNLIFIAGHFERLGDLATNIAEDAVYAASAEDIRHLASRRAD